MSDNKNDKTAPSDGTPISSVETARTVPPISTPVSPKSKEKHAKSKEKEKKKRRRKEIEIGRIPGVRKIALSELSQKIINCEVGKHVTSEKPWIYVKKELIDDNLELHEESSEFLPIRNEILAYPRREILIGFIPEEAGETDEFYICVTEASADAVQYLIAEQQAKQEARLQNTINKEIKQWLPLGCEAEVNETIPRKNRSLLEVEIESNYPILPFKIQFRLRTVDKARDGYMELITKDDSIAHVFCRKIDNATQVTPAFQDNQAQTICTYPSNASTQYEYIIDIDENVWKSYGGMVQNYIKDNIDDLMNCLYVNRNINLYVDDYQILGADKSVERSLPTVTFKEYMSFNDVQLCKGKMISCASFHRMISGVVAISYADVASTIYLKKLRTVDEVLQAVHGIQPVLIWSFVDPLNPRLILETHREISSISFCPFNENIVVGGAINGQVVLWDIKNRIQKVENQEILTNAQTKYRSYMRSLMGWMKDIYDVKLVRPTAISDLRHSHAGAVVRIQWISPYEEVGRTGKSHQLLEESEERSLQFMTAGEDGVVLIWDLLKKPTITVGGFREKRLRRLKQRPAGLSSEVSPFRILHLNLKPIYKINITHPKQSRLIPLSVISYRTMQIEYDKVENLTSDSRQSMSDRQNYTARPVFPEQNFVSEFALGTMEGDYIEAQWEGRDFDLGAIVNSENCIYIQFQKFHDGPVTSIAKHVSGNLVLTTGGKIFALWSKNFRQRPIIWRRSKVYYTNGSWSKYSTNRLRLMRSDGTYELWSIALSSKKAASVIPVASVELLFANLHPRELKYICIGISDALGNFRVFHLQNRYANKLKNILVEKDVSVFINKEEKRKIDFLNWQKEWCDKYVKKEEVVEVKPKTSQELFMENVEEALSTDEKTTEEKKEKPKTEETVVEHKVDRPAPGRYLEWVKEKELAKEQERIKRMILKKKSLDTEELEKQRKPLLKLEAENEVRRKKQKARIKGSENIFKETVAMLFPAIVKEKPALPPDPYAGGDPVEEKEKCYARFKTVSEEAARYMKNTRVDLQFSWKALLKEGRGRRKFLDKTFDRATHNLRYETYKTARKAKREPEIVSILTDQTSREVENDEISLSQIYTDSPENQELT
ncbi:hypothetical protein WA026_005773 [Henosepilachna vigintioctopunctata]|uniref:WD repeat-containing protein 63 n=1 Tax=Henosepilachna vigintioctopunctata TaxID=420089 RepID=A0AAW1TXF1_9CUCU